MSITNEADDTSEFMVEEMDEWDPIWKQKNTTFDKYLASQLALHFLKNLKFFVCNSNHRRLVWMNMISRMYALKPDWYYAMDFIILDMKGKTKIVMQVVYNINK